MEHHPVFIHALFRTGSTYLWTKFRKRDDFYCYYEPFNETLGRLDAAYFREFNTRERVTEKNRHPEIEKPYFFEYKKFILKGKAGVPFFKKSFSYDEFCFVGRNPDLQRYIDFLIDGAGKRTPLFQFNRSSMRVSWFKRHYPTSLNIYLFRNPRDQWQSYNDFFQKNDNPFFLTMDALIAGKNLAAEKFAPLKLLAPLFGYENSDFQYEELFYRLLYESYTPEERYAIFYYLWLVCLIENILHADYVLSIDALNADISVQDDFADFFHSHGIDAVDFRDVNIKGYTTYALNPGVMGRIETMVRNLVSSLPGRDVKDALNRAKLSSAPIRAALRGLTAKPVPAGRTAPAPGRSLRPDIRYRDMALSIAGSAIDAVREKDDQMDHLYRSYTYRLGNVFLGPIRKTRMAFLRFWNR
ncbi:MAG: hypothetical protein E4G96_06765 [Chrysiogenales bacterium]|nr:MAG: hypothetical protein E4G96_06765 [Chrysiogenales bacterium]